MKNQVHRPSTATSLRRPIPLYSRFEPYGMETIQPYKRIYSMQRPLQLTLQAWLCMATGQATFTAPIYSHEPAPAVYSVRYSHEPAHGGQHEVAEPQRRVGVLAAAGEAALRRTIKREINTHGWLRALHAKYIRTYDAERSLSTELERLYACSFTRRGVSGTAGTMA